VAEILSLSKARKARDRDERKRTAEENRTRFGRTRAERETAQKTGELAERRLEAHRLTTTPRDGAAEDDDRT